MKRKSNLTYFGHSCFKLDDGEISIVFDPYEDGSVPNLYLPHVQANFVLVSHEHFDHNAREKIEIVPCDKKIAVESVFIPHDDVGGAKRGNNIAHIVYLNGLKIIHLGDIGCFPNLEAIAKLKDADVMLAPINGFYTLGANDIYKLAKICKPKLLIPMHYYHRIEQSGYPDNNQFDIFLNLFPNTKFVLTNSICIEDYLITEEQTIAFK